MLCVVIIFFAKVAGSYKGTRKENEFVGETQEKPPELEANSDQESEKGPEIEKEELVQNQFCVLLPGPDSSSVKKAAELEPSSFSAYENVLTEPEEVDLHMLEVFPNLPISPIQKLEAATATQVELTPQTPLEPLSSPIGIDVTPFQWSWKEVRKQRQRETVGKYKQKLQNEVSPFSTKFLLI